MNVAQRKALLRYHPRVSRVWRRWYHLMIAEGVGVEAAREQADLEATRERTRIDAEHHETFKRQNETR